MLGRELRLWFPGRGLKKELWSIDINNFFKDNKIKNDWQK